MLPTVLFFVRELVVEGVLLLVRAFARLLFWSRMGGLLRCISIPRLREHGGRTVLTVAGIALGVSVLVSVSLVNRSILGSISETVEDVAGKADLQVQGDSTGFDEDLFDTVRATKGVLLATRVIEQTIRIRTKHAGDERVLVLGIDFLNEQDRYFRRYASGDLDAILGDPVAFLNASNHIVLSRQLARRLGYGANERLPVRTPNGLQLFESWGVFDDDGIGHAFGGSVAVMDYVAMQVAFERGRNIDRIDVALAPGADPGQVAAEIKKRIGSTFFVGKPRSRAEKAGKLVSSLTNGLTMASLVAVMVGMFLIFSTMAIGITQRRQEIGVLRALGMTRRQLVALFTLEGVALGCAGSSLGVLAGLVLASAMVSSVEKTVSELFAQVVISSLGVSAGLLFVCWCVGVFSTLVATCVPATLGARVEPTEALSAGRHRVFSPRGRRHYLNDVAAVLLAGLALGLLAIPHQKNPALSAAFSCVAIVVSLTLFMPRLVQMVHALAHRCLRMFVAADIRLANDNLLREIGRASATSSALMVGVAMSLSFASFVDSFTSSTIAWVDQMLPADLWLSSAARIAGGSSVPMTDALYEELRRLPGVEFVERVRMVDVDLADSRVKLISMDTEVLGKRAHLMMLEGSADEAKARLQRGEALVSENLAQRMGVHRGDHIMLAASTGKLALRIAGVIVDYTSDQGSILVERKTYSEHWRDTRVDSYKLYVRPGVALQPLRQTLYARWGQRFDLSVLTHREFRERIRALLEQTFGLMHGLELVAVVIAVLGVVNAIFANVLDRAREYGLLRAVGMLRAQVQRMVVVEAALIGIAGALAGVIAGLAIGYVLLFHINVAQTGWHLPYHPTLTSALIAALPVVASAAAAGWYPAKMAARSPISNALAYE